MDHFLKNITNGPGACTLNTLLAAMVHLGLGPPPNRPLAAEVLDRVRAGKSFLQKRTDLFRQLKREMGLEPSDLPRLDDLTSHLLSRHEDILLATGDMFFGSCLLDNKEDYPFASGVNAMAELARKEGKRFVVLPVTAEDVPGVRPVCIFLARTYSWETGECVVPYTLGKDLSYGHCVVQLGVNGQVVDEVGGDRKRMPYDNTVFTWHEVLPLEQPTKRIKIS